MNKLWGKAILSIVAYLIIIVLLNLFEHRTFSAIIAEFSSIEFIISFVFGLLIVILATVIINSKSIIKYMPIIVVIIGIAYAIFSLKGFEPILASIKMPFNDINMFGVGLAIIALGFSMWIPQIQRRRNTSNRRDDSMDESWLAFEVHANKYDSDFKVKMMLELAGPIIKELEQQQLLLTFHFFFEPFFLFRVLIPSQNEMERVKSVIEKCLPNVKTLIKQTKFSNDYPGEKEDFGDEGWLHVQKLFEYASRISLLKMETLNGLKTENDCQLNKQFNDTKLIHCYLNAQGFSSLDEANFHQTAYIERLSRILK